MEKKKNIIREKEYKIYKKLHTEHKNSFYLNFTPVEQIRMLDAIKQYEKENNIK